MKMNMWVSGFCTYACIHCIVNTQNITLAVLNGLFAITNLVIGLRD